MAAVYSLRRCCLRSCGRRLDGLLRCRPLHSLQFHPRLGWCACRRTKTCAKRDTLRNRGLRWRYGRNGYWLTLDVGTRHAICTRRHSSVSGSPTHFPVKLQRKAARLRHLSKPTDFKAFSLVSNILIFAAEGWIRLEPLLVSPHLAHSPRSRLQRLSRWHRPLV